jgi:15-cis-phytoene synthase
MELYEKTAYELSQRLTARYSTSFGLSITLFDKPLRRHIYAIYGLVRIADEIVDTYQGKNARAVLDELEKDTERAMATGYSANPIVHAFTQTARHYGITTEVTKPFFASMRMDLTPRTYDRALYDTYIYGSAEVVGLMCLRVFVDDKTYSKLAKGARGLGAAYQKVNFLRDIAADATELKRWYFPYGSPETFDEATKSKIIKEIEKDIAGARRAIARLPLSSQKAVSLSLEYFDRLLKKIKQTPAQTLTHTRIRISDAQKLVLLVRVAMKRSNS